MLKEVRIPEKRKHALIGRGFSHDVALELLDDENTLYMIELPGGERIKARLIGTRGKAKRRVETDTDTRISIYGKTVSIIGTHNAVHVARRVIERLIQGAPHRNAYRLMKR